MSLHMLMSAAPHWPERLKQTVGPQDELLLVGDGVYLLPQLLGHPNLYVREQDLMQRGLTTEHKGVTYVTDEEWVHFTLIHQPVVSWS